MGCGPTQDLVQEVEGSLEANLLFIDDGSNKVLVISVDALYVGEHIRNSLVSALQGQIENDHIFIAATHTHYAPMLDDTKPELGKADDDHMQGVAARLTTAAQDLVESVIETELTIEPLQFETSIAIERRKKRFLAITGRRLRFNAVAMAPSKLRRPNLADIVTLRTADGKAICTIVQIACHPTSVPNQCKHTAAYATTVRQVCRARQNFIPVLVFQGFSGDLRPDSTRPKNALGWIRRLAFGRFFTPMDESEYREWLLSLKNELAGSMNESPSPVRLKAVGADLTQVPLHALHITRNRDNLGPSHLHIQSVDLGPVSLLGISAEVVSEYADLCRSMKSNSSVLPVSCLAATFGYLPTSEMVRDGGYESAHSLKFFNLTKISADIEASFSQALNEHFGECS